MNEVATLAEEARRFLEAESPISATRAAIAEEPGYGADLWKQMALLGWLGVAVAEDRGGLGMGTRALAALAHEAGRALLPGPFLFTAAFTAPLLAGSDDDLLRFVLSGESVLAVAHGNSLGIDGGSVTGTSSVVVDAVASEHLLVCAADSVAIVDSHASGVTIAPVEWMDLARRTAKVTFNDVRPVARLDIQPAVVARAFDQVQVALSAESLGAAERALEVATAYAKQRVQFGKAIGSFQAVQHLLANMLERVELTRSAVDGAARALDSVDEMAHEASLLAKAFSGEACVRVTADAIQVHGGIGFTWEHDAHLYYRRTVGNAALCGTPDECRRALAKTVLYDAVPIPMTPLTPAEPTPDPAHWVGSAWNAKAP